MIKKFFDSLSCEVKAERINDQIWIYWNGKTYQASVEEKTNSRRGRKTNQIIEGNAILAPMPGKITKVLKKLKDKVVIGEPVIIMEAMKMEYTLKSPKEGIISKLNCKEGDQVVIHHLLAEIS